MEELGGADPRRIGPYELIGKLGSGGMGRVFLGRSAAGALAAVKVVHPDLARDPEFRRRFQREVAATVAVSGPHVAAIVHADADAELPWLATEYVAGPSLEAKVAEDGPLPPAEVAALGARLAGGLAAIHAAGLVHRDVKPSNILLGPDGPKLIDFGIARDSADSRLTRTGMAVGTPLFMAPEQIQGESEIGPPTDVFALAGVLVHAATGGYPFGDGTAVQMLYRIVHEEPRLAAVPEPMRPVLAACLDKDPARRPTAGQVAEALAVPSGFTALDAALDAALEAADRSAGTTRPDRDEVATEPIIRSSFPTQSAGAFPAADLPTVSIPRQGSTTPAAAGKRKQKTYILGGAGVLAAVAALVIAIFGTGGGLGGSGSGSGSSAGAADGAGLAGATDPAVPNGAAPTGGTSGTSATGLGTSLTLGPTSAAASGVAAVPPTGPGASSTDQASSTKSGQRPTGTPSGPGTHSSASIPASSGATSSHSVSKPSSSTVNTPTPPACSTDCGSMSHASSVVRSVHANKCIVANTNGAQYQLPALGSCTGSAAQWRIWRTDASFMMESLYYPGDCLTYGASTLAPCSSDWTKSGWWTSSAESHHQLLSSIANYSYCASVDSNADLTSNSCESSPVPDWQLWDFA